MKSIKNPYANLESKRFRFFKIGMIVSCSLALLAFRWTTYELAENKMYSPPIERESLVTELPPVSFSKMIQAKKVAVVIDDPSVIKVVEKLTPESKVLNLITLKEILGAIEEGWDPEGDVVDPEISKGPAGWMKAERTPYFDECAQPSDKKKESECTYAAIRNFVQSSTKYPSTCRELGIEGTVWLTFVIDKNGDVVDIEELKSPHAALTNAAMDGLSLLPKLNPGTQRLNPVDVRLEIPVRFLLRK